MRFGFVLTPELHPQSDPQDELFGENDLTFLQIFIPTNIEAKIIIIKTMVL